MVITHRSQIKLHPPPSTLLSHAHSCNQLPHLVSHADEVPVVPPHLPVQVLYRPGEEAKVGVGLHELGGGDPALHSHQALVRQAAAHLRRESRKWDCVRNCPLILFGTVWDFRGFLIGFFCISRL